MDMYRTKAPGHWTAADIRTGDPYEVSQGQRIELLPTQTRGANAQSIGASVVSSDPNVTHAATEAGYSPTPDTLRAPDVSVLPEAPDDDWGRKAPPLAIEYAGRGQDFTDLKCKIRELLEAGTQYLWVVRLDGPHRVEVYEPGCERVIKGPGEWLTAEGVLANPIPVEALYESSAAQPVVLRNLLQRLGYRDLDAVREEGRGEGRAEGHQEGRAEGRQEGRIEAQRQMVRQLLEQRFGALPAPVQDALAEATSQALERWFRRALTATRLDEVLA